MQAMKLLERYTEKHHYSPLNHSTNQGTRENDEKHGY